MSDEATDTTATAPTDVPKVQTPAADLHPHAHAAPEVPTDTVPQAEASVEKVTEPDPEHASEPAPVPPPELAEVAAVEAQALTPEPVTAEEPVSEALVPIPEPVSEELVPVHDAVTAASEAIVTGSAGATGEVAKVESPEPLTIEQPAAEEPAAEEPTAEEEPAAKPKRTRKAKAAPTATTPAAPAEPAEPGGSVTPSEAPAEPKPESKKKWYAIKVQSGREDTIKAAILRKVAIEGLEEFFGQIMIPVEEEVVKKTVRVKDKKTGDYTTQEKKVTRKKKKFQGYLFAELEFNDRILYLFRETSGVGDFLNLRGTPPVPEPMPEHEVQSMLTGERHADPLKKGKVIKVDFEKGDRVRILGGTFEKSEGDVKFITEPKDPTDTPKVTVVVTLWGRPVDVELDYWQVEKV